MWLEFSILWPHDEGRFLQLHLYGKHGSDGALKLWNFQFWRPERQENRRDRRDDQRGRADEGNTAAEASNCGDPGERPARRHRRAAKRRRGKLRERQALADRRL